MASLKSILNPEPPSQSLNIKSLSDQRSHSGSPSTSSDCSDSLTKELQKSSSKISYDKNHQLHQNCPDSFSCLPDTDGRPQHTYPIILRCAILGSPRQRLTIREIYATIMEKYPYFKGAGQTWKQSVRHHLSLNRLFERQHRPVHDPGFGSYWTVNLAAPPGTKRPRKRGRNKAGPSDTNTIKKRGRPPKSPSTFESDHEHPLITTIEMVSSPHLGSEDEDENSFGEDNLPSPASPASPAESEITYSDEDTRVYDQKWSLQLPPISDSAINKRVSNSNLILSTGGRYSNHERKNACNEVTAEQLMRELAIAQKELDQLRYDKGQLEQMLEYEIRKRKEVERALARQEGNY